MLLNYAPNYFNRVRLQYRHASLDHALVFRLGEEQFTSLKAGTFNGFGLFADFLDYAIQSHGYTDFAINGLSVCSPGKTEFIEVPVPSSLAITPGTNTLTDFAFFKCGYMRIEGTSATEDGTCKGHMTINGMKIINSTSEDFRMQPSEATVLFQKLDDLNASGLLYGANGAVLHLKRYINTGISRSLQKRFRG
jgi:hypothetical protein